MLAAWPKTKPNRTLERDYIDVEMANIELFRSKKKKNSCPRTTNDREKSVCVCFLVFLMSLSACLLFVLIEVFLVV